MAKTRVTKRSRWVTALPAALGGAVFGFIFGSGAAGFMGAAGGQPSPWLPLGVAAVMGGTALLLRALLIEGSGDVARRVFLGADQGTTPEYSVARGLEIRGQYEPAVAAYLEGAAEYPEDPEPLLQGARVLRDHLGRPEEALEWLLRARAIPELTVRERIMIDRDLVALYEGPLDRPREALPILARLADEQRGTQPGEWAARTHARLRTQVWESVREDSTASMPAYHRRVVGRGDPPASPRPAGEERASEQGGEANG